MQEANYVEAFFLFFYSKFRFCCITDEYGNINSILMCYKRSTKVEFVFNVAVTRRKLLQQLTIILYKVKRNEKD